MALFMLSFQSMYEKTARRLLILDSRALPLKTLLEGLGFTLLEETNPQSALETARRFQPDLLLGDFWGEQAETLISNFRNHGTLSGTPIILCAGLDNIAERIRKINGNVDDYLIAPVNAVEVKARIERVLLRHEKILNANPLSHLPGNPSIKNEIGRRVLNREAFAVIYLDLDHFKAYNDHYGYSLGDEVIQFTANLLRRHALVLDASASANFVGHVGGDDFVAIRETHGVEDFCRCLVREFDGSIFRFYSEKDQRRGFIVSPDRSGNVKRFPLMTVTLSVVLNEAGQSAHFGEISARCAEIKHYLKSFEGSNYLVDRRGKLSRSTADKELCLMKV